MAILFPAAIIAIIACIAEIICNKILSDKKQFVVYGLIVLLSIVLCISYYSDEYKNSILGMINDKINLERFVWIK